MATPSTPTGESGLAVIDRSLGRLSALASSGRNAAKTIRLYWVPACFEFAIHLGEWALSPRALALAFLAGTAILASSAWLRPSLSPDLSSLHLPLRWHSQVSPSPEEILYGPRSVRVLSLGAAFVALMALMVPVVCWRPHYVGFCAGLLLMATIAGNAVVCLNYPGLIELLDLEYEQRRQMIDTLDYRRLNEDGMANRENSRASPMAVLTGAEQRGDPQRGWMYLVYSWWLLGWTAAGVVAGSSTSLVRRFGQLAAWTGAGFLLAVITCWPRLHGELAWLTAVDRASQGDFRGAQAALRQASDRFEELGRLERTWLLRGKLEWQLREHTPAALFFEVYQLMRDQRRPRAIAYTEDLPWNIRRVTDYREGLVAFPTGFDRNLESGALGTGTPDVRRGLGPLATAAPPGPLAFVNRDKELDIAHSKSQVLLAEAGADQPAVRHLVARLWNDTGLEFYFRGEILTDVGRVSFLRTRNLIAAQDAWRRAAELSPPRFDCAFYRGMAQAELQPSQPDLIENEFRAFLARSAEKAVQADMLSVLGDAYLQAGRLAEARLRYAQSFDLFNIPEQFKNYRAQRRLGGL